MGKYDGPHFEVEDEDVVSIWIAKVALTDIPESYFQENYSEDDDEPLNPFSADFGFGYYDHDCVETYCEDDWRIVPIGSLIEPLSYSSSFQDAVVRQAQELDSAQTCYVFLLYNFKYDPKVTGIRESKYMRFLGVFLYDRNS
jgi:hypothetical protein